MVEVPNVPPPLIVHRGSLGMRKNFGIETKTRFSGRLPPADGRPGNARLEPVGHGFDSRQATQVAVSDQPEAAAYFDEMGQDGNERSILIPDEGGQYSDAG